MKEARFTVKVIGPFNFRENSLTFKAACIVRAMAGCPMMDIVAALASMDHTNSPGTNPDPPRWITHFAGLESEASGKMIDPWIQILNDGDVILDRRQFRELLAGPR